MSTRGHILLLLANSLTHPPTHPSTHSPTHPLTHAPTRSPTRSRTQVGPVAWHPSGRWCASAGGRAPVVWDLGDGPDAPPPVRRNAHAALLQAHGSSVSWLGFSPRGTLASAAPDGTLRVYELGGGGDDDAGSTGGGGTGGGGTGGGTGGGGTGGGPGTGKARRQRAATVCDDAAEGCAFAWGRGGGAGWLFGLAPGRLQAWVVPEATAAPAATAKAAPAGANGAGADLD